MVAERNPEVKNAVVRLEVLSGDERARYIAEMELKAWRDMESMKDYGIELGEAAGEAKANEKWQSVVAEKDIALTEKDAEIAKLRAELEAHNQPTTVNNE